MATRAARLATSSALSIGTGQLDQRDLDEHPRIGGVAQLDQRVAEALDGGDERRGTETLGLLGEGVDGGAGQLHEVGSHQAQEAVAQVLDELLGDRARVVTGVDEAGHRRQGMPGVAVDEGVDELVEAQLLAHRPAGVGDQLERRQRVAGRPGTLGDGGGEGVGGHVEAGVVGDPADVLGEHVGRQQVEAQVLRAAADGVGHLLRVGGGEDEDDVARRLLERLQQRGLGRLGQHVHLVEDVHLVPPRRAEVGLLDEVAHRLDAVVARRVELVDVVADAALDVAARVALAARLAVDGALAVEHLGEDPRRRRLARAPRAGEEVGLALAAAGDGVAQGAHDVILPLDLGEPPGAVAAVERRGGHARRAYVLAVTMAWAPAPRRRMAVAMTVRVTTLVASVAPDASRNPWSPGCRAPRRTCRRRRRGGRAGAARRRRRRRAPTTPSSSRARPRIPRSRRSRRRS